MCVLWGSTQWRMTRPQMPHPSPVASSDPWKSLTACWQELSGRQGLQGQSLPVDARRPLPVNSSPQCLSRLWPATARHACPYRLRAYSQWRCQGVMTAHCLRAVPRLKRLCQTLHCRENKELSEDEAKSALNRSLTALDNLLATVPEDIMQRCDMLALTCNLLGCHRLLLSGHWKSLACTADQAFQPHI